MTVKKKKGGGANWMDTYGDMVTLLLCFFVLLYSMSTISEENWKALVMSFNPEAVQIHTATPGGEGPSADSDVSGSMISEAEAEAMQEQVNQDIEELYQSLQNYIAQEGVQSDISVTKGDGIVYISFNQAVFFEGDSPVIMPEAYPILDAVSGMLDRASPSLEEVRVLGHTAQGTPDIPNDPEVDRTLSSQRATNVVIYVQTHSGVDPARLISEGYGQWRPVGPNETSEDRAKNRRVEMIVSGRDIAQELEDGVQEYYTIEQH